MNRYTIVSVLALLTAFATTGCFSQSTVNEEETAESEQSSRRGHVAAGEEGNLYGVGQPNQQLDLNLHSTDQGQGPHPEPWLEQAGPHPEPWNGKTAEPSSGGNGNGNGNDAPKEP